MNSFYRKYGKRALDIIGSGTLIVALSPIMAASAIAVKHYHGSPILFKPKRPGKDGIVFTMYKFRSMSNEKDNKGELLPDSERITSFGKFIRKTSIDELPELFNILKGDMSFVGPRPLSVKYLPYYTDYENRRHEVKPGLTGFAQVNGRNNLSWEERFKKDVYYVDNISFLFDLKIIFLTFYVTLLGKDIVTRGENQIQDFDKERMALFSNLNT
ncbi:sugar transferase [Macrococcoides canis]|uniref:sugar transferase n=1 Tax=Macrococcoides canis TaxID=1855823 RepID=UPI0025AA26B8|nr:sugar transferase [Macrococcus canis]